MTCDFRKFWTILLIVAFATMGISPACHFISGEDSYIEICNADNEIQRITLAEAGLKPTAPAHKQQSERTDCMFCIAGASGKIANVQSDLIVSPGANYLGNGRGSFAPKGTSLALFDARGPPVSIV